MNSPSTSLPAPLAVAVVSGGLDSVTLAYLLAARGYHLHLLSFDYSQRHKKEIGFARACAEALGAEYTVVDLSSLGPLLSGSALTSSIPVPDGHYAASTMAVTIVPNRNAIFLSIAFGIGVAERAEAVGIGVHAGDHYIYPDCRPAFLTAFGAMQEKASPGGPILLSPFQYLKKSEIVKIGAGLSVPYEKTWSCYKGGEKHCGRCGTCVERKEAFTLSGVADPTEYLS